MRYFVYVEVQSTGKLLSGMDEKRDVLFLSCQIKTSENRRVLILDHLDRNLYHVYFQCILYYSRFSFELVNFAKVRLCFLLLRWNSFKQFFFLFRPGLNHGIGFLMSSPIYVVQLVSFAQNFKSILVSKLSLERRKFSNCGWQLAGFAVPTH